MNPSYPNKTSNPFYEDVLYLPFDSRPGLKNCSNLTRCTYDMVWGSRFPCRLSSVSRWDSTPQSLYSKDLRDNHQLESRQMPVKNHGQVSLNPQQNLSCNSSQFEWMIPWAAPSLCK